MPLVTLNYHINVEYSLDVADNVSFHSTKSQIFENVKDRVKCRSTYHAMFYLTCVRLDRFLKC